VNAIAVLMVNNHMQSLQAEAAARHRLAVDENRPSLRDRIASAGSNLRHSLGLESQPDYGFLPKVQEDPYYGFLPKLQDYPHRG
jgi:hypothetical protein